MKPEIEAIMQIFFNHEEYNLESQDGKPCVDCGEAIPIKYDTKGKVDRSNRVDTNAIENSKREGIAKNVSHHVSCWMRACWQ